MNKTELDNKCLSCSETVIPFISFGKMPIANGFLSSDQFLQEYFFNLRAGICNKCYLVQLIELVSPPKLFHSNYPFYSSTSELMKIHFKEFAKKIRLRYLKGKTPFVIEIGSNDGIMLQNFSRWGIKHLGIEPSKNVAQVAIEKGINTISEFFNDELAMAIKAKYGLADAIIGANVICHVPDINSLLSGVALLLKQKGVFIFEEPYIGDILKKTSYDQIYDEHVFYFSAHSVHSSTKRFGLELVDVKHQDVHGGELRYTIAKRGTYQPSSSVFFQLQKEKEKGLLDINTYKKFQKRVDKTKQDLLSLLTKLKKDGKHVVGYGATSKSTTTINYFKITPDLVEFICDTTPMKQGKFSPGMHIPICSYEDFRRNYPDYALLFAWNHKKEILDKEKEFLARGGKFIIYVPRVMIIDKNSV